MTEFVEVKTQDLIGVALDWAVAKVVGEEVTVMPGMEWKSYHVWTAGAFKLYSPSSIWSDCGPLIESYRIGLSWVRDGYSAHPAKLNAPTFYICGPTALVAACRAIVMDKLGEISSVPKELV